MLTLLLLAQLVCDPTRPCPFKAALACVGPANTVRIEIGDPVESWPMAVPVGGLGTVRFTIAGANPVTLVQVRLNEVAAMTMLGMDFRYLPGMRFPVPAAPGDYPLTVWARDNKGCERTSLAAVWQKWEQGWWPFTVEVR